MTYDAYEASSVQRRLFLIHQMQGPDLSYNIPFAWIIEPGLDPVKLEKSVNKLINIHETLRTSFASKDGEIFQVVHHTLDFKLSYRVMDDPENLDIDTLMHELSTPFDLGRIPLWQMYLFQLGPRKQLLFFDIHHIIFDGFSVNVFLRDLITIYNGGEVPEPEYQYVDFAAWQNEQLEGKLIKKLENFWLKELGGELPRPELLADYPRNQQVDTQGDAIMFTLDMDLSRQLRQIALQENVTLYVLLLAAFNVLLAKYCRQEELVLGSVVHGRPHKEFENIIGMFVNTLVLRNFPRFDMSFREFLKEVFQNTLKVLEKQDYPFEMLVEKLAPQRELNRNPFFDVIYALQNLDYNMPVAAGSNGELTIRRLKFQNQVARFDLALMAFEDGERIIFDIEYRRSLFRHDTIERMGNHFINILRAIVENPGAELREIPLMLPEEKELVIDGFNRTTRPYPADKTVHELFLRQVEQTPDRVAVVEDMHSHMTYRELDRLSGHMASHLAGEGARPGEIVALITGRSVEMLIGLLGILKAGCAYLPIDPSQPEERWRYMLADANASIILDLEKGFPKTSHHGGTVRAAQPPASSHDLAYIIYTSGSTGRPKGVMVEHRNIVRLVKKTNYLDFGQYGRILQTGALDFDASTFEIWGVLLNGWTLHLEPREHILNPLRLKEIVSKHGITTFFMTTPLFHQVVDAEPTVFSGMRQILIGGEVLSPPHMNKIRQLYPSLSTCNIYGPTENTTYSTYIPLDTDYEWNVPIGKPIANSTAYIVDAYLQPVPIGVPGELVAGGDGVARGYMNNPELTAQKFIHSKFNIHNSKLYKTGDLTRWKKDGNIEFLGRIDQQVKIRGFRIEPGEVENSIIQHHEVEDAVVPVLETVGGEKFLCAYVVASSGSKSAPADFVAALKEYLSRLLPEYMVPQYIILLDKIPLTLSGKVDRPALPTPGYDIAGVYEAPSGELEIKMAELWSEILEIPFDSISVTANFFELGGHSLRAIILSSRIHKETDVKIQLSDIFINPTIRELSRLIRESETDIHTGIIPVEKQEYYPLSSAQKRLFFLDQFENIGTSYNMPIALTVHGRLDIDKLKKALHIFIQRHETMRTSFHKIDGQYYQKIHEEVDFSIEYFKAGAGTGDSTEAIIRRFVRSFDLSRPPLLRVGLAPLDDEHHLLLFDMHHIVSDGSSLVVMVDDITRLYGEEQLEPLPVQYKDFSVWQNRLYETGCIHQQEEFWLNLYHDAETGELPRLNLPTDFKRPDVFSFDGGHFKMEMENSPAFVRLASENGATLYMNLLAAFNVLLYRYSGQGDIIVGTGIAGRPVADLQNLVGMFINSLAMRNQITGDKTYTQFLNQVKENSIKAFENQDVQFEELVDRLNLKRDPSHNPLFDVVMVVQNFKAPEISIKDLVFTTHEFENPTAKFDITLFVYESEEKVVFVIEYCKSLFKLRTIRQMALHLNRVISQVIRQPEIKIADIQLLDEQEREELLFRFNQTQIEYVVDKSIHALFHEQVSRTPGNIAVVSGAESLTYLQLEQNANRLANYLHHEKQIQSEERVGLLLEPSHRRVEAIFGVLKAGGAYVPIDPGLPEERIKTMLVNAEIRVVISEKRFLRTLNRLQWECPLFHSFICLDTYDIALEEETEESELMDEKLWRYVGETATDDITGGGWLSSYTGEPLSRGEMDEYGDNILKKLSPLIDKEMRILEIGCASGISMYRLAPQAGFYFGTDLSEVIIERNRQQVKEKGHNNIQLACLQAHEIDRVEEKDFDLIIINSVIQCFPGHNHLRMVIRKCLDLLGQQGYLFIGDVMDQERKEALLQDLLAFKQADTEKKYKTKTDFSQELFISPGFFNDLRGQFPVIREVEITGKIGTIENELSKFRFDALLEIDKRKEAEAQPVEILKHQQDLSALEAHGTKAPETNVTADQLAYVIFTSGTTGIPKGVMVEHKGLANLCYWHNRYYEVSAEDNATLYAGFGFDASVWELFPYMLTGACVHVIPTDIRLDIDALNRYFEENNITVSFLPTQLCEQFMEKDNRSLRMMLTGGDKLRIFRENRYRLFNNYGPTENSVVTTACEITAFSGNIPIGPPIHNNRVYILHKDTLELQPLGVPGELCIAGDSLARGYLNDRELTAKKFIDNPHVPGERIYRTGDLARWLPDGNIQFLGRVDYQVKIRGYRIELGEIETRLLAHEQVKEACVVDREDNAGLKYLCAYIVPVNPGDLDESLFIVHLAGELPEYMIPAYFIKMEKFHYNLSGKIDRASLPAPDVGIAGDYVPPTNDIETQLTTIWTDILGIPAESIGIATDFFQLGGHSLKATILVSRIHQAFDVKIPLSEIFKTPTIREMGEYIGKSATDAYVAIEPAAEKEYYVLSSPQKRLYVLQQMEPDSATYNIPLFLSLEGDIDLNTLEETFKKLIQRHESLRTSFHRLDGIPVQKIAHKFEFALQYYEEWHDNIITDFVKPFDLEKAPLVRVGLVKKAEQSFILMVDMHHLITDGTSGGILQNEFNSLYNGRELPPLKLQYKDFAVWQEGPEYRELIHRQESYWLDKLDGSLPVLNLPQDFPRPQTQSFTGNSVTFHVEKDQHTAMQQLAEKHGVTLYSLFLSLYNVLLSKLSHQEDILVGTAVAGRRHRDLEKVIGMFVNTIVLRNYPEPGKNFNRFLEEIKTSTLEAFEHQEYPFEDLVEKIGQGRDTGRNPLFDVMFNYIHRNMSAGSVESEPGSYKSSYYDYENKTAKFDMTLGVWEAEESFICSLEYRTDLFKEETIKRFVEYFKFILETILDDPTVTLESIVLKSDLAKTSSTITQDIEEDFEF